MKLRTNLFLIMGGLLIALLLAQWWVFTHLKQQLRAEVSSTAFEVSRDTASAVIFHQARIKIDGKNKMFQQKRWEWFKEHPGGSDSDIFIGLINDSQSPVIELLGPGLKETIRVSQKGFDERFTGLSSNILFAMLAFIVLALALAGFFAHRLSKPLQNLVKTAQHLGEGYVGEQIDSNQISGPQEVQTAIVEFNAMSAKLEQLEIDNRQLQNSQQLSELGEIARGFAHSLRNPLNTLGLAADELAEENLTTEKKQNLNKIMKKQIQRIDSWIKSFMSLSQDGVDYKWINIGTIIDELVLELSVIKTEVSWHLEVADDCEVEGFEQELRTIFQVLLENAMEASDAEGNIEVILNKVENSCSLTILDQGKGIPEKLLGQLFVPKITSKGSGAGMGLFIAKRLAQSRYQGSLELNNRAEVGVEVVLTLLCKRPGISSSGNSI